MTSDSSRDAIVISFSRFMANNSNMLKAASTSVLNKKDAKAFISEGRWGEEEEKEVELREKWG